MPEGLLGQGWHPRPRTSRAAGSPNSHPLPPPPGDVFPLPPLAPGSPRPCGLSLRHTPTCRWLWAVGETGEVLLHVFCVFFLAHPPHTPKVQLPSRCSSSCPGGDGPSQGTGEVVVPVDKLCGRKWGESFREKIENLSPQTRFQEKAAPAAGGSGGGGVSLTALPGARLCSPFRALAGGCSRGNRRVDVTQQLLRGGQGWS